MAVTEEYPPAADLRQTMRKYPLPFVAPGTVDPSTMADGGATTQAQAVLDELNAALAAGDAQAVGNCFFPGQAYWKDLLALTWHLRTLTSPGVIASALLQTKALRGLDGEIILDGPVMFMPVTPVLQFIDCGLAFKTTSPAATCGGRLMLLPLPADGEIKWKIWVLSTWLEQLDAHPENEALLKSGGRELNGSSDEIETDVLIIGGGNAALALAARLKAIGVDSVMAERNASPGDNWALRYDCLQFHVPTSLAELPFMRYEDHLQSPHLLTRDELAKHARRYAQAFNLNMVTSAKVQSTVYEPSAKRWKVTIATPDGVRTATARHLVQATGFSSQKPYIPSIADEGLYKGISLHSAHYKNAAELREKGVKSVIIIGAANTAFDVLQDCHDAGLQTTMVARSPTYIVPVEYVLDKHVLGAYDLLGPEPGDRRFSTIPTWIEANISHGGLAHAASMEPDRYAALAAAGFPVLDGRHPDAVIPHHLLERGGGHYVDLGATKLIAEGKAAVRGGVEPVAYTATGLRFSDGSTVDADAILWCTGFADKNARNTAREILGGGSSGNAGGGEAGSDVLHPEDIAARLDATWGVDAEGEVRGMWKRQLNLDNYWPMGGHTAHHRWYSRAVAVQIKAELEGILPPAYRDTPTEGI